MVCLRVLAVLSLPALLTAQRAPPGLEAARARLGAPEEAEVRVGGEACVAANCVEAVELILEIFNRERPPSRRHLSVGHYRDVLMPYLTKITDLYARRRVEQELKQNRKLPEVRQWCAEALGIYGDHAHGATLERALGDRDDGVRRWAAWSLGRLRYEHAAKKLERLTRDRDEFVRANAIEALARIDPGEGGARLIAEARNDSSGAVRCALMGAVAELLPESAEALATHLLGDPDWRPRMRAVETLAGVRTKTSVDALIRTLGDRRAIVAHRALESLQELTGQPISQPEVWPKWWNDSRESFAFPDGQGEKVAPDGQTVTFAGIPVDSDHVAFVLDKSYLMKKSLTSRPNVSRDRAALDELAKVLERMRDRLVFNVYAYDEEVRALSKKPAELTDKSERRALKFAEADAGGRHKNMWQVLERVVSDPDIDTVYLISSGEADTGLYVHGNRIGRHLADLNRFFATTVHAICYSEREWDRSHVRAVAEATGGTFQAID